jgi:hypothetical protein
MQTAMMKKFFNFSEVADNTLELFRKLLGDKTFFIAYTNDTIFSILKVNSEGMNWSMPEGISMPIADSY